MTVPSASRQVNGRSRLGPTLIALVLACVAAPQTPAFAAPISPTAYQALQWRLVGPFRGGRVTAVAGHPAEPNTFYMGATGGGVWKTLDAGMTWRNISDGYLHAGSIGAIAVAPSNPNIIYVGAGEAPVRGVAAGSGDGLYRSDDAGKTWRFVGLPKSSQISKVIINPTNPDLAYVAVQGDPWGPSDARGVYRTDDGGVTWRRLLFVDASTGASDLSMDGQDPNVLYAAFWDHQRTPWNVRSGGPGSSLWKSSDGGAHWRKLVDGLPKLMGKIGVTVSPADPRRVWAMIEATEGGIFRSDDAGLSWVRVNADPGVRDRGWYYSHIFADPKSRDRVYVLAAPMVVSQDGGMSFKAIRNPHGDNHALWINPDHPEMMIEGNDGGATVSLDAGKTWSSEMNQPTGQFYRIETDLAWPYRIYSAQQDRSSFRIPSRTTHGGIGEEDWAEVGGGESSYIAFDRHAPRLIYATSLLGGLTEFDAQTGVARDIDPYPVFAGFRRGLDLKYRFNWNAPVRVSVGAGEVIYHGAQAVLRSADRGLTWTAISPDLTRARPDTLGTTGGPIMIEGAGGEQYATLTDLVVSPHDAKTIWTGSDDGLVHLTHDGGATWANVTPRGLTEGQINAIEVSPHAPSTAYIAVERYKLDDPAPYAFKTTDDGRTWSSIAAGLPTGHFVAVVREDPKRPGLLYAGVDGGVWASFDDGASWGPLRLNLPEVLVTDLQVDGDDLVASTQGRALWILSGLGALRELNPEVAAAPVHLFEPAPALRVEGSGPAAPIDARNPSDGATIYYDLTAHPVGEVTLEVLDSQGRLIRGFSSAAPQVRAEDNTVKGADSQPPPKPLPVALGMNRYEWDLRLAPFTPVADTIRFVSYRPPRVGPGLYHLRLTVDGKTFTRDLTVLSQPGLAEATPAQWAEQQAITGELYEMVNAVHATTTAIRARQVSLEEGSGHATLIARLKAWQEQVPQAPLADGVQDLVGFPSRLLSTQILHALNIADQPPPVTAALKARVAELAAQWAGLKRDAAALLSLGD
jgi:photosystem II stability/assembly factor-like uncharacterized protein